MKRASNSLISKAIRVISKRTFLIVVQRIHRDPLDLQVPPVHQVPHRAVVFLEAEVDRVEAVQVGGGN